MCWGEHRDRAHLLDPGGAGTREGYADNPDTGVGGIRTKKPPGGEDEDLYPTVGRRHQGAVQVSILGLYNFEYVAVFHLEARPLQTRVRPVNLSLPPLSPLPHTTPHTS